MHLRNSNQLLSAPVDEWNTRTEFLSFVSNMQFCLANGYPVSILYKSTAGRYRSVSYSDGPITARYRFIKNTYWVRSLSDCGDSQAELGLGCLHGSKGAFYV